MLSNFLIKIIVFILPTQLGLHFWPTFSRVAGIKIDYLSPTIYFLDILLIILVLLNLKSIASYLRKNLFNLGLFIFFILLNIAFSVSPLNSIFWWLRLILYLFVYITLRLQKIKWSDIRTPLFLSTVGIVFLEVLQLISQSSIGGLFYLLGERAFSTSTPGIGRLNLLGLEILRPIATFSHANSLAGYLLIVFYLFSRKASKPWQKIVPFLGILLSFSKTSIFALAFIIYNLKPEIIIYLSIFLSIAQPFLQNTAITIQSVSDRLFYFSYLKRIILHNPLVGNGYGNYIPALGSILPGSFLTPSKLQPIHNLFYLYLSEMGILGTLIFFISLFKQKVLKVISNPLVLGLIAILLFTGTLDHYSWTLPQNKLIFLFALAIMV